MYHTLPSTLQNNYRFGKQLCAEIEMRVMEVAVQLAELPRPIDAKHINDFPAYVKEYVELQHTYHCLHFLGKQYMLECFCNIVSKCPKQSTMAQYWKVLEDCFDQNVDFEIVYSLPI